MDKPRHHSGYSSEAHARVRSACLYLATKLGDLVDQFVIVGGLVPSLLIDQSNPEIEVHAGTMDLDIALAVALLDDGQYQGFVQRLREAGFVQDTSDKGNLSRHRWTIVDVRERVNSPAPTIKVDFLIAPTRPDDQGGKLRQIRPDFAAVIMPGVHLAFQDRRRISLKGRTIQNEHATRAVWVCGPGAYIVLKARAFVNRGANKDAYDLYYVVRNFGVGVSDVAACLRPLVNDAIVVEAIGALRDNFLDIHAPGPRRVAEFMRGGPDDDIQQDVVGFIRELLDAIEVS